MARSCVYMKGSMRIMYTFNSSIHVQKEGMEYFSLMLPNMLHSYSLCAQYLEG